jgi:hypothetical protein
LLQIMTRYDAEFTGSFSVDHARMIKRMKLLAQVPAYAAAEHRRLLSALDAVYRSHAHVCESFVGAEPSLAQGGAKEGGAIEGGSRDTAEKPERPSGATQLMGPFRSRALQRAGCPLAAPERSET